MTNSPNRSSAGSVELKRCPFCDSSAVELSISAGNWPAVRCNECGALGPSTKLNDVEACDDWNARPDLTGDVAQSAAEPAQAALAWWAKWGEQIIQGAVERGNAKYWADNRRQEEAFREWEQSGYEGDCRQCTNGSLTDYITRSVLALGVPPVQSCSADSAKGLSEPLQCLRCGTIDAFGPISKKDAPNG